MPAIKNTAHISNPGNKAQEAEGSGRKPHLVSVLHVVIILGIKGLALEEPFSSFQWSEIQAGC